MTSTPASGQPDERFRLVVQVNDHKPRKPSRRVRKNLHEPCPGQLDLFDPPAPENMK
ncbi:hypothetical protein ACWDO0_17350 [Nocardia rhamnosiphila]